MEANIKLILAVVPGLNKLIPPQRCPLFTRVASAAPAASLCAGHAQQLGGESPLSNLMEVKG
jgi:hypothetical protein